MTNFEIRYLAISSSAAFSDGGRLPSYQRCLATPKHPVASPQSGAGTTYSLEEGKEKVALNDDAKTTRSDDDLQERGAHAICFGEVSR